MLPNKDPIAGVKSSAYIREPPRTAKTVTIRVLKKEPDKESQNNKGKNAARVVRLEAITGQNILLAANL